MTLPLHPPDPEGFFFEVTKYHSVFTNIQMTTKTIIMKTKFLTSLLSLAIVSATSCSRSNDNLPANNAQVAEQAATSGNWRVSLFNNNGTNETAEFNGYSFVFTTGTITAIKNAVSKTGTWSVSTSSNKFNIDLGPKDNTNKPLGELTDDWRIISASGLEIQLKDDNNTEFVTFSKN
jgi:hypothetical protein